jgi:hypothetical protein
MVPAVAPARIAPLSWLTAREAAPTVSAGRWIIACAQATSATDRASPASVAPAQSGGSMPSTGSAAPPQPSSRSGCRGCFGRGVMAACSAGRSTAGSPATSRPGGRTTASGSRRCSAPTPSTAITRTTNRFAGATRSCVVARRARRRRRLDAGSAGHVGGRVPRDRRRRRRRARHRQHDVRHRAGRSGRPGLRQLLCAALRRRRPLPGVHGVVCQATATGLRAHASPGAGRTESPDDCARTRRARSCIPISGRSTEVGRRGERTAPFASSRSAAAHVRPSAALSLIVHLGSERTVDAPRQTAALPRSRSLTLRSRSSSDAMCAQELEVPFELADPTQARRCQRVGVPSG